MKKTQEDKKHDSFGKEILNDQKIKKTSKI